MLIALGCIVSFICGFLLNKFLSKEKPFGMIIIDHQSIPEEEPYLFFKSYVDPRALINKKTGKVDISVEKFISQK